MQFGKEHDSCSKEIIEISQNSKTLTSWPRGVDQSSSKAQDLQETKVPLGYWVP